MQKAHFTSRETTSFKYRDGVIGRYGLVTANNSIAVDPKIIPPNAKVEIDGVGKRSAHDTGDSIKFYHVDNFLGAGKDVVKGWFRGGINGRKK